MKKILNILTIMLTLCLLSSSSCSNDDIPMEYVVGRHNVTCKVNPKTIIDPLVVANLFVNQSVGNSIYEIFGHKLRIRLLVYDNHGKLVSLQEKNVDDYRAITDFSVNLPEGEYRIFSICDLVSVNGDEYWTLSEEQDITTLKMKKSNQPFGSWGCLIGYTSDDFSLDKDIEIKCDLNPMCVIVNLQFIQYSNSKLINYIYQKYHAYLSDSYQFSLYTYTVPGFIQFNKDGTYYPSFDTDKNNPVSIITRGRNEMDFGTQGYDYSFAAVLPSSSYVTFGMSILDGDNVFMNIYDREEDLRQMIFGEFYMVYNNLDELRWWIYPISEDVGS